MKGLKINLCKELLASSMRYFFSFFALSLAIANVQAQESKVYVKNIKTLQTTLGGQWDAAPILVLGSHNFIEISFDDLQHSFVHYTYTLTHCDASWNSSQLLESEYMNGFSSNRIEDYGQSMNTQMEYNHYTLRLPNDDVELLISGNYRVTVYNDDDDSDEPVFETCFSVLEPHVGIDMEVTTNTDIDTHDKHQQVNFNINYANYRVVNPVDEFKPVVYQNRRTDNKVEDLRPTYLRSNQLVYNHNRQLIFPAGNEYRRFEILDEYQPTMNVETMEYFAPYYHATLFTDKPRQNYIFDRDQNGLYYIRNEENIDIETESDYFYTHFTLETPIVGNGEVYLHGNLTNNQFDEAYRMNYNYIDHRYELVLPLKQGSYNYQYLFVSEDSDRGSTAEIEGNYYQTENEYTVLVYHRPFGLRYDKLVGYQRVIFSY